MANFIESAISVIQAMVVEVYTLPYSMAKIQSVTKIMTVILKMIV